MKLASLFVEVGANVNNFERGMKNVRSEIDQTSKHASFFSNTLSNAIGFGIANATTKAISGLSNLVNSVVSTGIEFNNLEQNSTLAFETMLGSVDKAKNFLSDLKNFAKKTPFELPGLVESSQRLLAFGFDAQKVIPMMTNIGDAVAGLGGSPEKLNRVLLAFGQIKAKGKIMAGEMLQLTEAGIPAWEMLAKKIGVSIPEAMKMGEKGMIDADTAITAILEGMNGKFGGLMGKQSKSWSGMLSNIKDTFTQVTGRVMKPFFDLGLKGMEKLLALFDSPIFETFVQKMTKGASFAANFIGKIGKGFVGLFTGDFKSFFNGLFGGFDKLNSIVSKYENKRFGWLSNFTPKEAITAIKGFINDLKYGGQYIDYWIGHMPRMLQPLAKVTTYIYKYLAGEGIKKTLSSLMNIFKALGSTLAKLVRPFKDALGSLFSQLSTMKNLGFADIFKAVLGSIGQAFMGFVKVIQEEFWPSIKGALVWVWNALSSFISSIDWQGVWTGISTGLSSIVNYVASIDWASVWSTIWSSLKSIGQWFSDNVLPPISNFFSWLLSWFSDPAKNSQLWNAITSVWTFISDWASYLWSAVSPYLGSFFGYLASWFTDPSKRQTLWNAVVSTWNFISDWAMYLWEVTSPYLSGFFNYLLSWFTDPTKRGQLWNGIVATWTFITDWTKAIWSNISPYLAQFWGWLSGWITDPTKRKQLWDGIVSTWNAITTWGANLWGWLYPKMTELWTNLKGWIDTNAPTFGSWIDAFVNAATQIKDDWLNKWPVVTKAFSEFSTTIKTEVPLIIQTLQNLFSSLTGDSISTDGIGGYFANMIAFYTRYFGYLTTTARIALEMLDQMVVATKAAFNFDWSGYVNGSMGFGAKLSELASHISTITSLGQGYATGGVVNEGRVLVGEKGPELVDLPRGSRVWDHGQSMGKLGSDSGQTVTIILKNEGTLQASRQVIDDIAIALQKRLNLQGNRVVFAS